MNSKQAAKRMMIILVLIFVFFSVVSMACEDSGGVQDMGKDAVNTVLFEQTQVEQNVINMLQESCSQSAECASHQLP